MRKDFYLLDELNDIIVILKAAGLIDFWYLQNIDMMNNNLKESASPKILTLRKLLGCFGILFFGCIIGFTVFFGELITPAILKFFRSLDTTVTSIKY